MSDILTQEELGERWQMTKGALAQQRYKGTGPRFFKAGRTVFYRVQDVLDWEESQLRLRTDDEPVSAA
ncbi:DNA-binding protein [Corynebacterium stationis]|uniref:DNA-binding protein n=1 Tax=Corynebacterium stationis TaxID=1705 RepID=UPI0028AEBEB8|nr:DNA-binding protein [Corynebacterium stationis]